MATRNRTENEAYHQAGNVVYSGRDAEQIRALNPETLNWFGFRRGDLVTFSEVQVSVDIEVVREYRYGFSGQLVERQNNRRREVVSEKTLKLWKNGSGWYWNQ